VCRAFFFPNKGLYPIFAPNPDPDAISTSKNFHLALWGSVPENFGDDLMQIFFLM